MADEEPVDEPDDIVEEQTTELVDPGAGNPGARLIWAGSRLMSVVKRAGRSEKPLQTAVIAGRELLPGDSEFGDSLSTAGEGRPQALGRGLAAMTEAKPGLLRELGMGALQVWQAIGEASGRGHGTTEVAIVFTDLAGFSNWALKAGDDAVVRLLRDVDALLQSAVRPNRGRIIKRLGDGAMAVFPTADNARDALLAIQEHLPEVGPEGYKPRLRAGLHVGTPRPLGGDYFGVDVNIAARLCEAAKADEILVSQRALDLLEPGSVKIKRRRRVRVKGVPKDLEVHPIAAP